MNAVAYDILKRQKQHEPGVAEAPLAVPAELVTLLAESPKLRASFWRLTDGERRRIVRFVDNSNSAVARELCATIIAMSLVDLARDLRDDGSSF